MSQRFCLTKGHPGRGVVLANVHAFADRLPNTKSWVIEIKEQRNGRTNDQNAALFGVAYPPIMEAIGLQGDAEKAKLHETFCGDFFGWVERPVVGRVPARTTTTNDRGERELVDTITFANFYNFIQRQMAEYGIFVPDPDPLRSQDGRWVA